MLQICNRLQILGSWRVFKNFWHLSFFQLVRTTNQVNDPLTWCNRPVERRNIKVNFQRYDIPLGSIVGLQIRDLNYMQIPFGQFKKVQERLPRLEIIRVIDQERIFAHLPVNTQRLRIDNVLFFRGRKIIFTLSSMIRWPDQTVMELLFALLVLFAFNANEIVQRHPKILSTLGVHLKFNVYLKLFFDFVDFFPEMVHHRWVINFVCLFNDSYCFWGLKEPFF